MTGYVFNVGVWEQILLRFPLNLRNPVKKGQYQCVNSRIFDEAFIDLPQSLSTSLPEWPSNFLCVSIELVSECKSAGEY